ncbi:exonuclease SbcCD subunit D [Malonomonas rubra]|uniref:exonuclease SbcCD subunit D n=1 Tax=Malonomonas rubra TaxID=57040 RepID=UPI0026F10C24|nr:exonuclease SbcCD subunit D [Malonomonas rubra]
MRFIHTSDWHLGRQFHNVSLLEDQRHVLRQIVATVAERQVDAVIVAGDIYDRSVPPATAVELLDEVVYLICDELQVPMIMISGNHDGPERLGFGARQMAAGRLHVVGPLWEEPQPIILQDVAFYPIPYCDPPTVRNRYNVEVSSHDQAMAHLLQLVRANNSRQRPCVPIAHCFLAGGEVSESERPLSLGGAGQVSVEHFQDFAYVALGHLHGPQCKGGEQIRYSGSPLKYSFSEQMQKKSLTLVELDETGLARIEKIPLQPLHDMRILEGPLEELLQAGKTDPHAEDYLLIRLSDTHAILDLMNKLRQVYPNLLHIERPGLMTQGEPLTANRERLKKGEQAMFSDFYTQVSGEVLTAEQDEIVTASLERLHLEER